MVYLKQSRAVALDCANATRACVQGRKLVEARATVDAAKLADASAALNELA